VAKRPIPTPRQMTTMTNARSRPGHLIIGCDEVGRGACAGPLVVVGVLAARTWDHELARDSKKMSHEKHVAAFETFLNYTNPIPEIKAVLLAKYDFLDVDTLGVDAANKDLTKRIAQELYRLCPSPVMLDGEMLPFIEGIPQEDLFNMVNADALVPVSGAASMIAKAFRDKEMCAYHDLYPQYDWAYNKGYLTMGHAAALKEHGACLVHRLSYTRVAESKMSDAVRQSRINPNPPCPWACWLKKAI